MMTQPTTPPQQPLGFIPTDTPCPNCKYNLRGLPISRDERLDIPLVHCPECGKYHPAGATLGIKRTFLRCPAPFPWPVWLLALTALSLYLLNLTNVSCFETLTRQIGFNQRRFLRGDLETLRPSTPSDYSSFFDFLYPRLVFGYLAVKVAFLCAAVLALLGAPLRKRFLWATILIPPLALLWTLDPGYSWILFRNHVQWSFLLLFPYTFIQCLAFAAGLLFAVPFARFLLPKILRPDLLRRFHYLWQSDNKPLPPWTSPDSC